MEAQFLDFGPKTRWNRSKKKEAARANGHGGRLENNTDRVEGTAQLDQRMYENMFLCLFLFLTMYGTRNTVKPLSYTENRNLNFCRAL